MNKCDILATMIAVLLKREGGGVFSCRSKVIQHVVTAT